MKKVLVIGSGAREHALAYRISRDPDVEVHAAPGNGGIEAIGKVHPVDVNDPAAITALAKSIGASLVVHGPEAPLVAGAVEGLVAEVVIIDRGSRDGTARLADAGERSKDRHDQQLAG